MDRDRHTGGPAAWGDLARSLRGSLSARARGLVSPELILLTPENEPFGRLLVGADGSARIRAGDLEAEIRPSRGPTVTMTTDGGETLTAEPAPPTLLLRSGGRSYEARVSLLRNRATALSPDGIETVRLSGGLTNRRYRATFDPEDPASLPMAVFLLHHTFGLRRRAYRANP